MLNMDELRTKLAEVLDKKKLEQKDFAQMSEVPASSISRFLSGRRSVSIDSYLKIVETINTIENG